MENLDQFISREKKMVAKRMVESYFENVVHPFFPNCNYTQITDKIRNGVHIGIGASVVLSPYNYQLQGSNYYYHKELYFIHYTSLKNCINIIREQSFRIYALNSMDDTFELKFASREIFKNLKNEQIESWKKNVYSLSMCEMDIETKGKSLDLWRRYGEDGFGVGIVLRMDSQNQSMWYKRFLSKIYYDSNSIKDIVEKHSLFIKQNRGFPILGDFQELLLNMCSFHKPQIYENEKEVRYLECGRTEFDMDGELSLQHILSDIDFPLMFNISETKHKINNDIIYDTDKELDLNRQLKSVHFKRIAITNEYTDLMTQKIDCPFVKQNQSKLFPLFKIEKIVLGYRYNDNQVSDISLFINKLSEQCIGYPIKVEVSTLKKYF